jgi:hypothetical protein
MNFKNKSKKAKNKKNKLLKKIREYGYFEVRFDFISDKSKSSQKYFENKEVLTSLDIPLIAFT